ncbi:MAG TPA: prepilin-type N-terminal cleavage/methylation domain-containing protein [Patescibacteria group bacterium]|nr:prepilin-type N-terminal cleavage/methylation domain-containing protein [Patescibacteria group bacterium]
MEKNKIKYSSGFTIVELLLYVAISSVMLLTISLFLQTLLESKIKNQTVAEVEQQGLQAMQMITQTARNADAINSPARGASASLLSINTYIINNNPTIFDLFGGAIRVKEGVVAAVPLTNSRVIASALDFQNLSRADTPGTIRIQFTLTHINPENKNEYDFSKTFIGSASLRQP